MPEGRSSSSVSQFLPSCSWSACQMPVKELRSELRHFPSTDLQDMSLNTTDNNIKESWRSRIHSIRDHKLYCHLLVKPQHHRCTHISTHPKPLPAFLSMSCSALVSSSWLLLFFRTRMFLYQILQRSCHSPSSEQSPQEHNQQHEGHTHLLIYSSFKMREKEPNGIIDEDQCIGQKFGIGKIFSFFKDVSPAHQGCIHLIKMQKYYNFKSFLFISAASYFFQYSWMNKTLEWTAFT